MNKITFLTLAMSMVVIVTVADDMAAPIYDFSQLDSLWQAFKLKYNKTYNACDDITRFAMCT